MSTLVVVVEDVTMVTIVGVVGATILVGNVFVSVFSAVVCIDNVVVRACDVFTIGDDTSVVLAVLMCVDVACTVDCTGDVTVIIEGDAMFVDAISVVDVKLLSGSVDSVVILATVLLMDRLCVLLVDGVSVLLVNLVVLFTVVVKSVVAMTEVNTVFVLSVIADDESIAVSIVVEINMDRVTEVTMGRVTEVRVAEVTMGGVTEDRVAEVSIGRVTEVNMGRVAEVTTGRVTEVTMGGVTEVTMGRVAEVSMGDGAIDVTTGTGIVVEVSVIAVEDSVKVLSITILKVSEPGARVSDEEISILVSRVKELEIMTSSLLISGTPVVMVATPDAGYVSLLA